MTEARRDELRRVAEGWSGLAVLLSPLPLVGECISDFCHRRSGKYYCAAFGPMDDAFFVRLTTVLDSFMEARRR